MVTLQKNLILLFGGFICLLNICKAEPVEVYADSLSNPIPRQVRFSLTIENPTSRNLLNQKIWLYAPVKRTATQQLESLTISYPYMLEEDDLGNQIIRFSFDSFPAYSTRIITVTANLLMSSHQRQSELKRPALFLDEETYVEKNYPPIQLLAASIADKAPIDPVEPMYQWVKSNMIYAGYVAEDLGAKYAMSNRRGDCTEYAYLIAALGRASGIPSRILGGFVLDKNRSPQPSEYHNWTETYINGRWEMVDAQKENYRSNVEQYVAMQIISPSIPNSLHSANRFRVEGDLILHMNR